MVHLKKIDDSVPLFYMSVLYDTLKIMKLCLQLQTVKHY